MIPTSVSQAQKHAAVNNISTPCFVTLTHKNLTETIYKTCRVAQAP